MTTLLKNGYIVNPANDFEGVADILIQDGKIAKIEECITDSADKIVDCSNLHILPGLVDMHVHLRDPGYIFKEDIISGCQCAVSGGVTSLLCMPNTKPVLDSESFVEYVKEKAKDAKARVYITGAISKKLEGEKLTNFKKLKKAGVIAVSDDGRPVKNAQMMTEALIKAHEVGLLVTSHCEDLDIIDGGLINDGQVSKHLGIKGMHRSSEDYITAREIILAETNNVPVHIAHVSTKLSTELIKNAKARGVKVTAETCPHYFSLTEQELLKQDADYRMNPPLREEADMNAILEGVREGVFDCIVTDHAPHTKEEKKDFFTAPNGVIGMETSFSASYTYLVKTGVISLMELAKKMSLNPAKILGINAGTLNIGAPADIAVFDLQREWTVNPLRSQSRARNCVYKDRKLTGRIRFTFVDGKKVYDHKKDKIRIER